jgi:hypothetical protein
MRTDCNTTTCQCETCHCSVESTDSLVQTSDESKIEWRDRITSLFETKFRDLRLQLISNSRDLELANRGAGHNFCLIFGHVLDHHVLITPHSQRGCDISVYRNQVTHIDGMYDVKNLEKVIAFVSTKLDPKTVN